MHQESQISPEEMIFSLGEKINLLKKKFTPINAPEQKYHILIEMGRNLPPFKEKNKIEKNLVRGCQSKLYLYSYENQGKIFFEVFSDALISAGLAALLINTYQGEPLETLIKHSPDFLHELGIYTSLSPNRSNGLSQIHLKMQQDALQFLIQRNI
jgi:cysteine desulfuration protein SufE